MLGIDDSEQSSAEIKSVLPLGIEFVLFPVICTLIGFLILSTLPWLIGAYNYLRGASSPIDQAILALLGSDLSRLVVLVSSIIGIMIGLYLSRFVTMKLDIVKKKGEAQLSVKMYIGLILWWMFPQWAISTISLLDMSFNGFATSRFLTDLGIFIMAGYFLAFSIPVLLKYAFLVLHTRSIDSQIILVGLPGGSGFKKRFQHFTLRVIHLGPDP